MLETTGLPQFSHIDIKGYKTHLEAMLKRHLEEINLLLKTKEPHTWDSLIYPLETLEDELARFWSPLAHLHSVKDSPALRLCYEQCLPLLSAYESAVGQNQKLYDAILSLDKTHLNAQQIKIIDDCLLGFKLSGVALSSNDKKRFQIIQAREDELSNQFEKNTLDATQAFSLTILDEERLAGLPQHALDTARELAAEQESPGPILNLEFPCYQAVITYAEDRSLREEIYQAYVTRASDQGPHAGNFDNTAVMNEILALRHEKALLLGFKNYAELSLATKMAESPKQVVDFMEDLVKRVEQKAQKELKELKAFAKERYHLNQIQPWDLSYLSEKRRQDLYNLSQEELRPYFPEHQVLQGLFTIVKRLYGMTFEKIEGADVWHKDVQCYGVIDQHNQVRGFIYTDLYARPHKRGGAWMDSLQSRRRLEDGRIQLPIATLTCNFAKASANRPAMLSHEEVLTLFHELGHCLHHILTQVDYLHASGLNHVEWDAVELPSQFFENWCWDQEALSLLTAHVETGEKLPEILFERLLATKNFQSAMALLRQMEFSLFDFLIHQEYTDHSGLIETTLAKVREKTALLSPTPYNRFQHSFSHIFGGGYAAGYYSYIWAELLSSDAFSRFEEEGVFNSKTGQDFLNFILEVGGSKKAAEAYQDFRGRPATMDALLRHRGIQ